MGIQTIILRLAALLVLLSSACDYCAFDMFDSEASMSLPGPVIVSSGHATGAAVATSNLPDDRCLCCSPSIPSQAATLERPLLISTTVEDRAIRSSCAPISAIEQPPRLQPASLM